MNRHTLAPEACHPLGECANHPSCIDFEIGPDASESQATRCRCSARAARADSRELEHVNLTGSPTGAAPDNDLTQRIDRSVMLAIATWRGEPTALRGSAADRQP